MGNPMVSPVSRGKPAILASLLHQNPVWGYAFGMGAYALAFGLRWYLDPILPRGLPFITFLPAVLLVAYFAGRGPAIAMGWLHGVLAAAPSRCCAPAPPAARRQGWGRPGRGWPGGTWCRTGALQTEAVNEGCSVA